MTRWKFFRSLLFALISMISQMSRILRNLDCSNQNSIFPTLWTFHIRKYIQHKFSGFEKSCFWYLFSCFSALVLIFWHKYQNWKSLFFFGGFRLILKYPGSGGYRYPSTDTVSVKVTKTVSVSVSVLKFFGICIRIRYQ